MCRLEGIQELIKSVPCSPGVYLLCHEPDCRMYIGFSTNKDEGVRHRIAQHFDDLVRGRNPCTKVQECWNADPNPKNWSVDFLEVTRNPQREIDYMKAFSIDKSYDLNTIIKERI